MHMTACAFVQVGGWQRFLRVFKYSEASGLTKLAVAFSEFERECSQHEYALKLTQCTHFPFHFYSGAFLVMLAIRLDDRVLMCP